MSKACARMTAMRGLEAGPPQVLPRNLTASPKTQKASVFLLVQFSPDAALILTLVGGGGMQATCRQVFCYASVTTHWLLRQSQLQKICVSMAPA